MKQQVGPCSTLKGQSNLYTLKCFNLKVNQVTQIFANLCFMVQGIQTTVVYWPVKLRESGKVLFFRLQLWDCGENALRRFDHLFPVCIKYKYFHAETEKRITVTLLEITVTPDVLSNHSSVCLPVLSGAGGRRSFPILLH